MTVMQMLYTKIRVERKCGHRAALRAIGKETGIDVDSVQRTLDRARRTDAIEAKRVAQAQKRKPAIL